VYACKVDWISWLGLLLDHLSHADGLRVLRRCRESGARWLIATTFPSITETPDITTGDFRPVNLELPPYSLPPPVRLLDDSSGPNPGNRMGVWRLAG